MVSNTQKRLSKIVGVSFITMALVAALGYGYAFNSFYSLIDSSKTIKLLTNPDWLLRSVIASFLTILILDIIIAWALFLLLKKINSELSLITAWFRLIYSALLAVSVFYLIGVLQLLKTITINTESIMFQLNMFVDTWNAGLIIFGVHLILLGTLLLKSSVFPRVISYLVLFAGICYFFTNIAKLLLPAFEPYIETIDIILGLPMALGELSLAVWFLIKGGKRSLQ